MRKLILGTFSTLFLLAVGLDELRSRYQEQRRKEYKHEKYESVSDEGTLCEKQERAVRQNNTDVR